MIQRSLAQRPLVRSAAVLAVGVALVAVLVRLGTSDETIAAPSYEPYSPFRMTNVSYGEPGESVTTVLTWRSQLSWETEVVAETGFEGLVGGYTRYDHGHNVSYNAMFDRHTNEHTYDGTDDRFLIPSRWLVPEEYTVAGGWIALGTDPDGYQRFGRVTSDAQEHQEIYRVDPDTGMVAEVIHAVGGELVTVFKVLSYTPLAP